MTPQRNALEFYRPQPGVEFIQSDPHPLRLGFVNIVVDFIDGGRGEFTVPKQREAEIVRLFFDTMFGAVELDEHGTLTWYQNGDWLMFLSERDVIYTREQIVALASYQENAP